MSSFINEDLCTLDVDYFLKKSLGKNREIASGSILQIQQISNLSVPKQDGQQNYDAERHVLKLVLTDGDITICSLVIEPLQRINMNTPPGAKIKITQTVPVNGQIFLLTKNNHQFLGGDVPKLIEKWNFQRKMDIKQEWGATGNVSGSEGPPIWRPFGQKSAPLDIAALRRTKAMDIVNEKKDAVKDGDGSQTEFDVQRKEAISELMEKSVKQKFQKPNKHLLDKDIVIIMEEGFSIEEATEGLKRFKHPQKALKFLKARNGEFPTEEKISAPEERKERKKRNPKDDEEEDNVPIPKEYQRPTRNISLFGFIAEHIKSDDNGTESSNDKRVDELSDSFENMDYRDRDSRGRGGRGYRSRGSNQRFRGSDGHGMRRGGYSRADSDGSHRFESQSSFLASDTGGRGKGYTDSRGERAKPEFNRGRGRQESDHVQGYQDYGRDREKSDNNRDQGQDPNRGQWRQDYNRDEGRQEYSRGRGRPEYSRGQGLPQQEYNRDQGRQDYNRGGGRQEYGRDQGQQDYNRDQGRQIYKRDHEVQDYNKRDQGLQDYDRERNSNVTRQLNKQRDNYPSLSQNQNAVEPDSRKGYSQAPRFQKQMYSSGETAPVPFSNSSSRGHHETSRLPSSQSFPQPENYQHPSRSYEYNSGPRSQTNGFRIAPPEHEQYQYGNSDGWSPNQSMVFTRSKPGFGGGRMRGDGTPSTSRY